MHMLHRRDKSFSFCTIYKCKIQNYSNKVSASYWYEVTKFFWTVSSGCGTMSPSIFHLSPPFSNICQSFISSVKTKTWICKISNFVQRNVFVKVFMLSEIMASYVLLLDSWWDFFSFCTRSKTASSLWALWRRHGGGRLLSDTSLSTATRCRPLLSTAGTPADMHGPPGQEVGSGRSPPRYPEE